MNEQNLVTWIMKFTKLWLAVSMLLWASSHEAEIPNEDDPQRYFVRELMPTIPSTFVAPLNFTHFNSSSTLNLSITFDQAPSNSTLVKVNVLYQNQSTALSISHKKSKASMIFCFDEDSGTDSFIVMARSDSKTTVRFILQAIDIELAFKEQRSAIVSPESPSTFLVNPMSAGDASRFDRYVLQVTSDEETKDICMIVAAYGNRCPFKNQPDNIKTADMWFTALQRGAMTIRYERFHFNVPFYVSIVVLDNDDACHSEATSSIIDSSISRIKNVTVSITKSEPYLDYLAAIGVTIFITLVFIVVAFTIMSTKRLNSHDEEDASVYYSPNGSREEVDDVASRSPRKGKTPLPYELDAPHGTDVVDEGAGVGITIASGDEPASIEPMMEKSRSLPHDRLKERCKAVIPEDSSRLERISKGLERLNPDAKLTTMTSILENDVWFRRNRSRVYCYLVPLLSLFYFIPSIQFVFLVKQTESLTGSQDLCYHNFECAKPLSIFSDFNHIFSNISYMLFGLFFLLIVRFKAKLLPNEQKPKNDHKSGKGILQQLSIFYAMGFALCAQGFFSICYHVCPTNHSLQFDSTMMYVICMLGIVKLYQFRHPDANANAYSFFYFLGGIVLLEALALYSTSWWVYGIFLLFYVFMTILIAMDCYFNGVGRLDRRIGEVLAKNIFSDWQHDPTERNLLRRYGIKYPKRFGFALIFCCLNFIHALFITISKWHNPTKTVTHVVLLILAGNLILYILYYVFRKNLLKCQNFHKACRSKEDHVDARYQVKIMNRQIPCFLSAGSFFAISAVVLGAIASQFYLDRNANRNLSPAESRNLNAECRYFNFYDNHDMWHLCSASSIFMAFLALMTVDDDMLNVPREDIEVF